MALSWGFAAMGLNRIEAQVHPDNLRSLNVPGVRTACEVTGWIAPVFGLFGS